MFSARAAAVAPTCAELKPKSFAKNPGAVRLTWTVIVSFGTIFVENVMSPEPRPPPFLTAYWSADEVALPVSSGSACAPARAAASAVDCAARSARYHDGCLSLLLISSVHSTRSVVVLEIRPDLTTRPSKLIEYG